MRVRSDAQNRCMAHQRRRGEKRNRSSLLQRRRPTINAVFRRGGRKKEKEKTEPPLSLACSTLPTFPGLSPAPSRPAAPSTRGGSAGARRHRRSKNEAATEPLLLPLPPSLLLALSLPCRPREADAASRPTPSRAPSSRPSRPPSTRRAGASRSATSPPPPACPWRGPRRPSRRSRPTSPARRSRSPPRARSSSPCPRASGPPCGLSRRS